jgi:hypothetical protein
MTRTWMLCASPFAFAGGMMLAHCSSSSSTGTGTDGGKSSTSSASKSSSGPGSSSSKSGSESKSASASSTTSASASSSSGIKDAGADINYAAGDYEAGCVLPDGGAPCTPGKVGCAVDAGYCSVPTDQCCTVANTPDICQTAGATCAGHQIECEEAADCTGNKICCLNATGFATATLTCQPGPTCPTSMVAAGQICRSDKECASGSCVIYTCINSTVIQACEHTVIGELASTCMPTP